MQYNYDHIKALAKETGARVTDLIALAPQNDPFYAGTPGDWKLRQWFADLWQQFNYGTGVHLRRVHYQIISQDPPVEMPNGKPYENTEACWDTLSAAAKAARYLHLVDPAAFVDRRNPDPVLNATSTDGEPEIYITGRDVWDSLDLPDFPTLPDFAVYGYQAAQRYHLEIWCEKSTMNDVLLPFCQRYDINLVTGVGEMSITATLDAVRRIAERGKPARLLYISDFDPAGQSMPVAVGRKIEYFVQHESMDADIRLFPVVLTEEQCKAYRLPRTPIKETEKRGARFEARYGTGATELDALEALHPGELEAILRRLVESYYDADLSARVYRQQRRLEHALARERQAIIEQHADAITTLQDEYAALRQEFSARASHLQERIQNLWQAISDDLESVPVEVDDYPVPEAQIGSELAPGLYNSQRSYIEQIDAYKAFQGKLSA